MPADGRVVDIRALTGEEYPARLRELGRATEILFVAGELPAGPSVAIVGTRSPSRGGRAFARELASNLAARGIAVFSGGALGIDTAAHEGAILASGKTVVVAPSSFDRPYPEKNAELFRRIVDSGGAFVTTQKQGTGAKRGNFFVRNAELVALTDGVVIVETRLRGGARNAAAAARRLSRPVLVVPGAPWRARAQGCLLEIQRGATLVTSADDVARTLWPETFSSGRSGGRLGLPFPVCPPGRKIPSPAANRPEYPADSDEGRVLAALQKGGLDPDELCREAGLPPARVQASLLTLTLEGIVVSEPSGRSALVRI